jgi:hypothetical protein
METEFHYYAVAVLARAAGFRPADALTIATASQYVDDATESGPIRVGSFLFDPVRTAHEGLHVFSWSVQKKIYMPFHFLPAQPFAPDRLPDPHFETLADSPFANLVLDDALAEPAGVFRLCRIGIALHAFADTWAHQHFSGKRDRINNISALAICRNGRWVRPFWNSLLLDILPRIGHPQASAYPDLPHLVWRYRRASGRRVFVRDNPVLFLQAARRIHERLLDAPKPYPSVAVWTWAAIEGRFQSLFSSPDEAKRDGDGWREAFGPLFDGLPLRYDKLRWRIEAFDDARKIRWDGKSRASFRRMWFRLKDGFYDSAWVHFHRAAQKHLDFVLARIV